MVHKTSDKSLIGRPDLFWSPIGDLDLIRECVKYQSTQTFYQNTYEYEYFLSAATSRTRRSFNF